MQCYPVTCWKFHRKIRLYSDVYLYPCNPWCWRFPDASSGTSPSCFAGSRVNQLKLPAETRWSSLKDPPVTSSWTFLIIPHYNPNIPTAGRFSAIFEHATFPGCACTGMSPPLHAMMTSTSVFAHASFRDTVLWSNPQGPCWLAFLLIKLSWSWLLAGNYWAFEPSVVWYQSDYHCLPSRAYDCQRDIWHVVNREWMNHPSNMSELKIAFSSKLYLIQ